MKPFIIPALCGLVLTGITGAGFSHWWSVREIIAAANVSTDPAPVAPAVDSISPAVSAPAVAPAAPDPAPVAKEPALAAKPEAPPPPASSEEFYRGLIVEMNNLRNQNRDLRDQMAETNRDLMKLEFRVDTHSESFRPLQISEDRIDTTFDAGTGVLPPLDDALHLPAR